MPINVNYHLFADDLQIYDSDFFKDIDCCVNRLNIALDLISNWTVKNQININSSKTQAIIITYNKRYLSTVKSLKLNIKKDEVQYYDSAKNLGLIINPTLSWEDHVNNICRKIYITLGQLWPSAYFTPINAKLKLIRSLIVPHILYCAPIYSGCSETTWNGLNIAFNACARYIFNIQRNKSISNFSKQILNCDLRSYLDFANALFLFKVIKFKQPSYLYDNLAFSKSSRTCNINLPKNCLTKSRQASFFVNVVKIWNSLPIDIKCECSLSKFKKMTFEHISSR